MDSGIKLCVPKNYFRDSSTATATETVMPTMGERPDRRRGRRKGGERVAAVGKTQACFARRSGCRAPQQETTTDSYDAIVCGHCPLPGGKKVGFLWDKIGTLLI